MMMDIAAAMIWFLLLVMDVVEEKHKYSVQLILAHAVLVLCFIRLALVGG